LTVYNKWLWADKWKYCPYWQPLQANLSAAPGVGWATFAVRYGEGEWEDLIAFVDAGSMQALTYCYVQLRGYDMVTRKEVILWTGIVPTETLKLRGASGTTKTADQILQASSLDVLLDTRLDGAWVKPTDAGSTPAWLDYLPAFNSRYELGGDVIGNRSEERSSVQKDGWDNSIDSYSFSSEGFEWGNFDIANYLLQNHQEYNGPAFGFRETPDVEEALNKLVNVYNFRGEMTVRQALNVLINRTRGFSWTYEVDADDRVDIVPFSLLDERVSFGGVVIPENPNAVTLDLWSGKSEVDVQVVQDISPTYDKIIVRGAKLKTCFTASFAADILEKGWTDEEEKAFKEAAKNTENYDTLGEAAQAELNDKFRNTDRFERVFTTIRLKRDWDWTVGPYIVNPLRDADGIFWRDQQASVWNTGKRFLNYLPLEVGKDYSGDEPVDNNPDDSEPEFLRMFVLVQDRDNEDKYVFVDRAAPFPAAVRALAREMGFSVRFRPQYMLARGHYDSEVFEPAKWTGADIWEYGYNYEKLLATVFLETDQFVQVEANLNDYENKRVLLIELPECECWYIIPQTVVGVDDAGELIKYGCDAPLLRDDRDKLRAALAAAEAWYGKDHNKISITTRGIEKPVPIGTLIRGGDVTGINAADSVVTTIAWNFTSKQPTIKVSTDFAPLDIAGGFRAAGSPGPSAGTVTAPTARIAAKRLEQLEAQVKKITTELAKSPLRIEPSTMQVVTSVQRCIATESRPADIKFLANLIDAQGNEITEGDGYQIWIDAFIYSPEGTNLDECLPEIIEGKDYPIVKLPYFNEETGETEKRWYCFHWFKKKVRCKCEVDQ